MKKKEILRWNPQSMLNHEAAHSQLSSGLECINVDTE